MSDLKLKQNGLRILDSRNGDLMIVDPGRNMSCMFTIEYINQAIEDDQKMARLGKKFIDFVKAHTAARWKSVYNEIALGLISAGDNMKEFDFFHKLQKIALAGGIDSLRKVEKDLYFRKQQNAKND